MQDIKALRDANQIDIVPIRWRVVPLCVESGEKIFHAF